MSAPLAPDTVASFADAFSTFAKEGGRIGWGSRRTKYGGGALGGVGRCVRR